MSDIHFQPTVLGFDRDQTVQTGPFWTISDTVIALSITTTIAALATTVFVAVAF